jgi:TPR repeat protein
MAVHWYQKAAEQGNPLAQYAMGNFYSQGRGVTNDMDEAIKWWRKAADQNQPDAQAALGDLYLIPDAPYGTNYLNYPEAMRLLRLAAAQGSVSAINNLGVAYEAGLAVKLDFREAAKCYRIAADQGDALAQGNLGQLYFDGRGVPFDLEQAYKWFKLSSLQGQILGVKGLANFTTYKLLTSNQLAKAEQMVSDYRPILTKNYP